MRDGLAGDPVPRRGCCSGSVRQDAARDRRERACRANNVGVARLEQFDYDAAVTSFRSALRIDPLVCRGTAQSCNCALIRRPSRRRACPRPRRCRGAARRPSAAVRHRPDRQVAEPAGRSRRCVQAGAAPSTPPTPARRCTSARSICSFRNSTRRSLLFQDALVAEPYNATAAYGLAQSRCAAARTSPDATRCSASRRCAISPYAVTYSQGYLQQGRYGEAIVSTGAEPELVDEATPRVTFTDATRRSPAALPPIGQRHAPRCRRRRRPGHPRSRRDCAAAVAQRRGRFVDATAAAGLDDAGRCRARDSRRWRATTTTTAGPISSSCASAVITCCTSAPTARSRTSRVPRGSPTGSPHGPRRSSTSITTAISTSWSAGSGTASHLAAQQRQRHVHRHRVGGGHWRRDRRRRRRRADRLRQPPRHRPVDRLHGSCAGALPEHARRHVPRRGDRGRAGLAGRGHGRGRGRRQQGRLHRFLLRPPRARRGPSR